LTLTGCCLPFWVFDYYAPAGEGGKAEKTLCEGRIGPPDGIRYSLNGVDMVIQLFDISSGIRVHLSILIPDEKTVKFEGSVFSINTCDVKDSLYSNKLPPSVYRANEKLRIEDPLVGNKRKVRFNYFIAADFDMPKSKCLNVIIPPFKVNDTLIKIPMLQFKKDSFGEFCLVPNC
jgi:hypothetical protein